MKFSTLATASALSLASFSSAQTVLADGCLRLIGSAACPAYSYAYVHPQNLSNAFPWMAGIRNVNDFDAAVFTYFSNPNQWQQTKFGSGELGCSNATNAYIRWSRTVLCSMWVNEKWSINCDTYYNDSTAATSQKMVCQQTCIQYAAAENQIVNNQMYCPGPDNTGGNRSFTLQKDFVDCTNWATLQSANLSVCIAGETNEGNCGYGSSTEMLCNYCNNSNPDSCCYSSNTDISVCGFALPSQSSSVSASASMTSTVSSTASASASSSATAGAAQLNSGLSGGQKAGIAVGSIIGGILLLALLALLLFFCCIKPRRQRDDHNRDSGSSFAPDAAAGAGTGAAAGGMFGLFGGKGKPEPNSSEKGLIGRNMANASSPTMGGDTLYSRNGNRSHESNGLAGLAGAGAAGAAAGAFGGHIAGERTSGVVLPRVKDENQNGDRWIETGSEVTVLWPYQASLPDELDLRPGMKLRVLRLYDDAWGTAQVVSGGEGSEVGKQGAFPIVCVSEGSSLGSSMSTGSH